MNTKATYGAQTIIYGEVHTFQLIGQVSAWVPTPLLVPGGRVVAGQRFGHFNGSTYRVVVAPCLSNCGNRLYALLKEGSNHLSSSVGIKTSAGMAAAISSATSGFKAVL